MLIGLIDWDIFKLSLTINRLENLDAFRLNLHLWDKAWTRKKTIYICTDTL